MKIMYNDDKYRKIFEAYGFSSTTYHSIVEMWNQPHRFYHNQKHLENILDQIEVQKLLDDMSEEDYEILVFTAFFHDIVYVADPKANNEKDSAIMFYKFVESTYRGAKEFTTDMKLRIYCMITDTSLRTFPESPLSERFWLIDNSILFQPFSVLLEWEKNIFKEWQHFTLEEYRQGRMQFLRNEIQ
jgi:predicted metal-dependent HD superfamily phosphohydrolase